MSKRTRPPNRSPARPTLSQRVARNAAGYSSWGNMLYRDPVPLAPVANRPRPNRYRSKPPPVAAPATRPRRATTAFSSFFPSYPPPPSLERLKAAIPCVQRAIRRQALFATRRTGTGSRSPKRHYSNKGCK